MKTKLPTEWQELSDQLDFQEFTPIQTQLFDPLLAGENLLGVSPTGTGKTLACLLYTSPSPRDATLSRMPSSA